MKSRGNPRASSFPNSKREISFYDCQTNIITVKFTIIFHTDRDCRKMAYLIFVVLLVCLSGALPLLAVGVRHCAQRWLAPNSRRIGFHMRFIKVELSHDCYQGRCDRLVPSFLQAVWFRPDVILAFMIINLLFLNPKALFSSLPNRNRLSVRPPLSNVREPRAVFNSIV